MTCVAPSSFTVATLPGVPTTPTTSHPATRASWTSAHPTPPPAECTSTFHPARTFARFEQRVVRGDGDGGEGRRLLRVEGRRDAEHLVTRDGEVGRVAAEAGDGHDARADGEIVDPVSDGDHAPAHLEAGRDWPAHVGLRRLVEPHAHETVGVVHADGFALDDDLTGARNRVGDGLEKESFVGARARDGDATHAGEPSAAIDSRWRSVGLASALLNSNLAGDPSRVMR